jgi:two-component system, NarL family, nitrate/nitrite response regulator NarL
MTPSSVVPSEGVFLWAEMRTVRPMSHDSVYNEQILPLAQNASPYVTAILLCQNALVRSGISHLLSGTHFIVSERAVDHPRELPILCLIYIDQVTDEVTATVERLKEQWPLARVVVLSDHTEPASLVPAFQAGLDGLCSPAMDRARLIKALELVMLGETFISAAASIAMFQLSQARPQAHAHGPSTPASANDFPSASRLTDREAQILLLLTKGTSNKQIARDLEMAEATVKVHVKAILRKVKVPNRTAAAMWAQQHLSIAANDVIIADE